MFENGENEKHVFKGKKHISRHSHMHYIIVISKILEEFIYAGSTSFRIEESDAFRCYCMSCCIILCLCFYKANMQKKWNPNWQRFIATITWPWFWRLNWVVPLYRYRTGEQTTVDKPGWIEGLRVWDLICGLHPSCKTLVKKGKNYVLTQWYVGYICGIYHVFFLLKIILHSQHRKTWGCSSSYKWII